MGRAFRGINGGRTDFWKACQKGQQCWLVLGGVDVRSKEGGPEMRASPSLLEAFDNVSPEIKRNFSSPPSAPRTNIDRRTLKKFPFYFLGLYIYPKASKRLGEARISGASSCFSQSTPPNNPTNIVAFFEQAPKSSSPLCRKRPSIEIPLIIIPYCGNFQGRFAVPFRIPISGPSVPKIYSIRRPPFPQKNSLCNKMKHPGIKLLIFVTFIIPES